jgi:hypothetical protein
MARHGDLRPEATHSLEIAMRTIRSIRARLRRTFAAMAAVCLSTSILLTLPTAAHA